MLPAAAHRPASTAAGYAPLGTPAFDANGDGEEGTLSRGMTMGRVRMCLAIAVLCIATAGLVIVIMVLVGLGGIVCPAPLNATSVEEASIVDMDNVAAVLAAGVPMNCTIVSVCGADINCGLCKCVRSSSDNCAFFDCASDLLLTDEGGCATGAALDKCTISQLGVGNACST